MSVFFKNYEEFERFCFPKRYKERKRKELIEKKGFGDYLAQRFLNEIKKELEKK